MKTLEPSSSDKLSIQVTKKSLLFLEDLIEMMMDLLHSMNSLKQSNLLVISLRLQQTDVMLVPNILLLYKLISHMDILLQGEKLLLSKRLLLQLEEQPLLLELIT